MSIHPSLVSKSKRKRQRSVLKRFERLKELLQKEKWQLGGSVFGLPKLKAVRWKLKKTKKTAETEVAQEAAAAEGSVAGATAKEKTSSVKVKEESPKKK